MSKFLGEMEREVHENNVEKGWFDSDREFGDDIALLHSEVSEVYEAYRKWGLADQTYRTYAGILTNQPFMGDHGIDWAVTATYKPEGVGSELADVLIRLLDTARRYNIDLEAEYERKMAYNKTRPYRHGDKKV